MDLNALVTVPIKTRASWAVFVTEVPAIRVPTMNPLSKALRFFHFAILIKKSESTGPAQHATEHDWMLIA